MGEKERKIIDKELIEGSKKGYRFRANAGMGWQGKIINAPQHILKMLSNWMAGKNIKHKKIMIVADPRPFHGMDDGFYDVFGWDELTLCEILKIKDESFPCMQEGLNDNKDCEECGLNINIAVFEGDTRMKNKFRKKLLSKKNEKLKEILEIYYNYFDKEYPGWRKSKDADYIENRLKETAQKVMRNKLKRKYKIVEKKDFLNWPFKKDRVIIVQTSKIMISIIIDFKEYAINGLAQTALNLEFAHDAGKAIIGKSVSEFIKIGKGL